MQIGDLTYYGKAQTLVPTSKQTTNKIVDSILQQHQYDANSYAAIAPHYWKGNAKETAKGLFDFLKQNIAYKEEPFELQTVKTPAAIWRQKHGDCKHYALFIVGVCDALNRMGYPISAKYRFTADRPGENVHHVFAAVSGQGNEWQVDPVVSTFDKRPTFFNVQDYKPMIQRISGTVLTSTPIVAGSYIGKRKKKNVFKSIAAGMQVNLDNLKKGVKVNTANLKKDLKKIDIQKVTNVGLKVGGVAARKAFLTLVSINAMNLAGRLKASLNSPQKDRLLAKWKSLGGNPSVLVDTVNIGLRRRPGKVGEPVTTAAIVALATAVIAALSEFLKMTGKDAAQMQAMAAQGGLDLIKNTSNAIDTANGDSPAGYNGAAALDNVVNSGNFPTMDVSTGMAADGTPTLAVHDINSPGGTRETGALTQSLDDFKGWVSDNKGLVAGGLALAGIVYIVTTKRKRK